MWYLYVLCWLCQPSTRKSHLTIPTTLHPSNHVVKKCPHRKVILLHSKIIFHWPPCFTQWSLCYKVCPTNCSLKTWQKLKNVAEKWETENVLNRCSQLSCSFGVRGQLKFNVFTKFFWKFFINHFDHISRKKACLLSFCLLMNYEK